MFFFLSETNFWTVSWFEERAYEMRFMKCSIFNIPNHNEFSVPINYCYHLFLSKCTISKKNIYIYIFLLECFYFVRMYLCMYGGCIRWILMPPTDCRLSESASWKNTRCKLYSFTKWNFWGGKMLRLYEIRNMPYKIFLQTKFEKKTPPSNSEIFPPFRSK